MIKRLLKKYGNIDIDPAEHGSIKLTEESLKLLKQHLK